MTNTPLNPDALEAAWKSTEDHVKRYGSLIGVSMPDIVKHAVTAYLAVAQPEVNSVEELDQLPTGTVVRDSDGDVWERWIRSWKTIGVIHEFVGAEAIILPASVLYCPEENDD